MSVSIEDLKNMALQAGKIISAGYNSRLSRVEHKGDINLVTETDYQSEKLLVDMITRDFPEDGILTEENSIEFRESRNIWIIDPLDGTTNFTHRFPFVAVSIGFERSGEMILAVVYNPILKELFFAEKGKGAYLNDTEISTSDTASLDRSLIATGFPYDRWQRGDFYIREYLAFMKKCQGVRRVGAAAVDLCYLACGRFDGFFERKLKPWDTAAGSLILSEAGGTITDFNKQTWNCRKSTILASNGLIHDKMFNILNNEGNVTRV